jgi:hypothetical protein
MSSRRWVRSGRVRVALVLCLSVLSTACDYGLATRGGLVHNATSEDLVVEIVGASPVRRLELPASLSANADARNGECLGTGIALSTPDGELLTTLDERVCDGQMLTIEQDDLPSAVARPAAGSEGVTPLEPGAAS